MQRQSAQMLTWYDRKDLENLVKEHFEEKTALQGTITALRQVQTFNPISSRTEHNFKTLNFHLQS